VFAGVGDIDGHLRVQRIGRGDGDHFDIGFFEHVAVVKEDALDAVAFGEGRGVSGRGRGDGYDFGFFGHELEPGGVDIGFELGADDADFNFSGRGHLRAMVSLREPA